MAAILRRGDVEPADPLDLDGGEVTDLVVAAHQHAEQQPRSIRGGEQTTLLEHRSERQGAGDERFLVLSCGGHLSVGSDEAQDVLTHLRRHGVAVAVHERSIEQAVAYPSGDARHRRVTALGRFDHPVEGLAQPVVGTAG